VHRVWKQNLVFRDYYSGTVSLDSRALNCSQALKFGAWLPEIIQVLSRLIEEH